MRIFIFGGLGSGKSTMALRLGRRTALPVYHLDRYFFKAPNIHVPAEEGAAAFLSDLPLDGWRVEGNHNGVLEHVAAHADLTIILKVPPWLALARVLKRRASADPELRRSVSEGWVERMNW